VANPWRFASGYFDSGTGLYKYGTRYYNPGFGRWSQQDPLRGQLNDPTSLNRYVYAGDDPVNFTDPRGTCSVADLIGLFVLLAAAVVLVLAILWPILPVLWAAATEAAFFAALGTGLGTQGILYLISALLGFFGLVPFIGECIAAIRAGDLSPSP